jgi:hypothetical protein
MWTVVVDYAAEAASFNTSGKSAVDTINADLRVGCRRKKLRGKASSRDVNTISVHSSVVPISYLE